MLQIKNITKKYILGNQTFHALKGVSVNFRKTEFVSILGHSGSGKTTLLNIIGGLDRYDAGDLVIDSISTKDYSDRDWDAYRNHRIGFVFQSYNLIPHLDILSNVELALTLSGVDQKTRIKKATEVLRKVGLIDHLNKKPNQLSGGQQQRVAIARALVNDPTIVLADEPTGALDSETSQEIMELLTEISKDRLIIMVTHNSELADKYSNRIVRLKDGLVTDDSNPYEITTQAANPDTHTKTAMSYMTALRLSFKNLLTKKIRTFITALAGSIGIIGVALVLALQYGFNDYLSQMEQGTFAGMPIQISSSYFDIEALMNGRNESKLPVIDHGIGGYQRNTNFSGFNTLTQSYIDALEASDIRTYSSVVYNYSSNVDYLYLNQDHQAYNPSTINPITRANQNFIIPSIYSDVFLNEYFDVLSGRLYQPGALEAVLIVSEEHRIPYELMSFFGFDENQDTVIPYQSIIGQQIMVVGNNEMYQSTSQGFSRIPTSNLFGLYQNPAEHDCFMVTITGIIKTNTPFISSSERIIFGTAVQDAIFELNYDSDVVIQQRISPTRNVISNQLFGDPAEYDRLLSSLGGSKIPSNILIYPKDFDSKDEIRKTLDQINETLEKPIVFTDQTAAALSMMKTVMNSISAVLIAFASISLFVSSIMIGIITYTSVLERTKEIGVLRSIGARKKDISNVFNAESVLIGAFAGSLGVLITYGLVPIVNLILKDATEADSIANLYYLHAIMLIVISIALTLIAGLVPSRIAAKKDPVVALRSE